MLNQKVIDELVAKINFELDVPFVPEGQEERVIRWAVGLVSPHIPVWVLGFMSSLSDGLTMDELELHLEEIVRQVNGFLDIPWVPETIEASLIRPVVRHLLEYALAGAKMPEA